jgi:hypothetical protein
MKQRCLNPRAVNYRYYGAAGVGIAPEFMDFEVFYRHIGARPPKTVLDRIDRDRGYEPGNVRWVTPEVSSRNRRKPVFNTRLTEAQIDTIITLRNEGHRIVDIALAVGVPPTTVDKVLRRFRMTERRTIR